MRAPADTPALLWWELAAARAVVLGLVAAIVWTAANATISREPLTMLNGVALPGNAPVVEPLELKAVSIDTAREVNAATPVSRGPNPAARPFVFQGSGADLARATDCLAAAIHYEAGNETLAGRQAVAQVVLNRARHPAYPKSVCGVVFQGQERRTGCQFTFTCDGAMARPMSAKAWARARSVASAMLAGTVYAPVGLATHYHTDWVLPAWSSKLEKIRAEGTHLFFRWSGAWGSPRAFVSAPRGAEDAIGKLAAMSPAHAGAAFVPPALDIIQTQPTEVATGPAETSDAKRQSYILVVDPGLDPSMLAAMADQKCGDLDYCKVLAWTDRSLAPRGFPVPENALATLAFSYLRNRGQGFEKPLWNCAIFPRGDARQCMRHRLLAIDRDDKDKAADAPPAG